MNDIISSEASVKRLLLKVIRLSIPAILAELTSVAMQYIDAAMVGSLGKNATAAIGLVSTTTWLIGGLCISSAIGFSVQVAQLIGAGRENEARDVMRQGLLICLAIGFGLAGISALISSPLPAWLGGETEIRADASSYFFVFALALPFEQLRMLSAQMLQSSGDIKTPSILNIMLCLLDVVFNFLMIFPTRTVTLPLVEADVTVWGAGLGVQGAALGTALSEICIALLMAYVLCFRSKALSIKLGGSWRIKRHCLKTAAYISLPAAFEHTATCGAYVASTLLIAPLGSTDIAAHSLGVTAESFCYMPGYGISTAATTLVGQSIGAGKKDLAKKYARISIILGMSIMSIAAVLMYFTAPFMFSLLTSSAEVQLLGTQILRIEAFAEPLYAASIVCSGVLRGAGDTLAPSIINLISMWGVRITLITVLISHMGLHGVWLAMCIELCCRGLLLLTRTIRGKWLNRKILDT